MATPEEVDVWVGLDVGKDEHFAEVLDDHGDRLFSRAVGNDQAAVERLLDQAAGYGTAGLAIDQPGSIAQLALAVAAQRGTPVAYVPGLVMRRAADLYPGRHPRHAPHPPALPASSAPSRTSQSRLTRPPPKTTRLTTKMGTPPRTDPSVRC